MYKMKFLLIACCLFLLFGNAHAALLGVNPGFPNIGSDQTGKQTYSSSTGLLSVNSNAVSIVMQAGQPSISITGIKTIKFNFYLDATGLVVGGVAGNDLEVYGDVDVNGDMIPDYSGLLLSGEIMNFGHQNIGTTDLFDYRFSLTGGSLAPLYGNSDIGITNQGERSTFTGSFMVGFVSNFKGHIGPITPICTGEIGDFIWNDVNRNGIQDAGEPALQGITVLLKDNIGNIISSAVTDLNGAYHFTGLCAGYYLIDVDDSTLSPGLSPTLPDFGTDDAIDSDGPLNGGTVPVTLQNNNTINKTVDFGYMTPCAGEIGDYVWYDTNRNGIQDAGEPGINNVLIQLKDSLGTLIAETTTDQNGAFKFTGLCAGEYILDLVENTLPAGLLPTGLHQGTDIAIDSDEPLDGSAVNISLSTDYSKNLITDFGFIVPCTGKIGNFVWHDLNRNGLQDNGEPGITGVTVWLKNSIGAIINTTITGSNGFYQFIGLCADSYQVDIDETTLPPGFIVTDANVGSDDTIDSDGPADNGPVPVILTTDSSIDDTNDFGYKIPCTGSIGNFIWHDLNRNGIQDAGEPGLVGVTVKLRNPADNTLIATTISGANGFYQFTGLCAGGYKAEVDSTTVPSGMTPTLSNVGTDRSVDSDSSPVVVNLATDFSNDATVDFGYQIPCTGSIGNFIWHDLNYDGIQDAGEPGLVGVTVKLRNPADNTLIATTISGANGFYQFTGLCAGVYKVEVDTTTLPAGMVLTAVNIGLDRSIDSNASPALITLSTDFSNDNSVDFGFYIPGTGCTLTPGYWKTHSEFGHAAHYDDTWSQLSNGASTQFYLSGKTWYQVLGTNKSGGSVYYSLAYAYIAAYLNRLNGAYVPSEVQSALSEATNKFFKIYTPAQADKLSKKARSYWLNIQELLDNYNNGRLSYGPCHCS